MHPTIDAPRRERSARARKGPHRRAAEKKHGIDPAVKGSQLLRLRVLRHRPVDRQLIHGGTGAAQDAGRLLAMIHGAGQEDAA